MHAKSLQLACWQSAQLFATSWTVARQAPLSMEFPRQEYWSGLPCPPTGDLPNPGIELPSLMSLALAGRFFTSSIICKAQESVWKWKWVTQSCLTLCNPTDCIVHGVLQARILEWVVLPFSRGSSQPRDLTQVSWIAGRCFTVWATKEAPCTYLVTIFLVMGFVGGSADKESACNAGNLGLILELGRSPGERKDYTLQFSGLENSMDYIVHGVTKSWTRLSDFHVTFSLYYTNSILF